MGNEWPAPKGDGGGGKDRKGGSSCPVVLAGVLAVPALVVRLLWRARK